MARRYMSLLLLLLAALAISGFVVAGKTSEAAAPLANTTGADAANYPKLQPTESTAVRFDVSPPLRDMVPLPVTQTKAGDLQEGGPNGDSHPAGSATDSPISSLVQSLVGPLAMPTPLLSFDGPPNLCGCSPPDPNGEVGPNNYVVMTNLDFQIYDKSGTSLFGPAANNTLWSGFGGGCQTHNDGDPVVVYDQFADRWLLSQFTASAPYYNCVALSQTGDPTGAYYRWAFPVGNGNNFGDYPKFAVWSDAYHISTREFAGGSTFVGVGAYALDRAQMIAGNPNPTVISFLAPPSPAYVVGDGILPADIDGSTLPPAGSDEYYMGSEDNNGGYGAPNDALTLWKFHADFGTPANSTFTLANTIPTAPFNSVLALCGGGRSCIPQPGTSNKIDHQGYRQRPIFRLAYRNMGSYETLVTNQSVSAGTGPNGEVSGINWWEVRSPASSPIIYQQGTYAPGLTDGIHRWMGSLAMDHDGNMALGFSAGNATLFPSIYYTGRLVSDPLGQMPQGEAAIVTGTGSQTSSQRWGDYSDMTVDPVDDCTFWFVSEYVPTTSGNGWRTRIGSFKYPGCNGSSTPTPTASGTPPTSTPTDTPTNTPSPTATACGITSPINEGFEGGLNTFSSVVGTCVPGGCGWTSTGNPHSGSNSAFAPDLADVSDQYLELTNPISIPAGSTSATLTFWHAYDMENTYDGGVLEVSTDGGSTWADVTAVGGSFISGGYDDTISTAFNSPIAGRQAWTGAFTSYRLVSVNLNSLIGQSNLKIRFREANDESLAHVGWNVDDVLLSVAGSCGSVTATPTGATATAVATCVPGQLVVGPNAPASGNIPFKHTNTDTKLAATGSGGHGGTATVNLPFAPITFLLDDGTYENSVGWTDQSTNTEYGSIWLNRFTPPAGSYPIALNTVSIEWPDSSSGTLVGKQVRVLVYSDADGDGDPSNATLLDNQVVTVASLDSFLDYTVNATITSGDIYAGFEDLWADPGYTPPLYPAAIDTDSSNLRSYVAANDDNSAPDYTNLGNNQEIGTIEALSGGTITGNWLIRTSGDTNVASCVTSTPVPPTDTVVSTDTPVATDTPAATATCVPGFLVVGPSAPAAANVSFKHTSGKISATGSGAHGGTATLNLPFAPITFLLDDGTYESGIGWNDMSTESAAIWINRFTPPAGSYPITLNTVSIEWPQNSAGTLVGLQARILVYSDADGDGDPSNATLLSSSLVTIASLDSFLDYTVNATITSGDIYVGFEDQWAENGYTPLLYPAAIDTDSTNNRSYVAAMGDGSAPDYTNLGNNDNIGTIDDLSGGAITGNWLIRTSGDTNVVPCATGTATVVPPTDTAVVTGTPPTDTPTAGSPTETPTACTLSFEDVPPDHTFYAYIECLACRGIINGYPCGGPGEPCNGNNDPYFRPGNDVTRGQFSKIASNSAGFNDPAGPQQYEDVLPGSTFYDYIWRLTNRGLVNGYPCGGVGEPCGPGNLPYFRPNANVTRGQLAKIDANAAGLTQAPGAQQYEDVLPGSTFYDYIWRLTDLGVMNGYPCGGIGEPCGPNNLPYFRPGANATRGQASKIVSNTFFPSCQVR